MGTEPERKRSTRRGPAQAAAQDLGNTKRPIEPVPASEKPELSISSSRGAGWNLDVVRARERCPIGQKWA